MISKSVINAVLARSPDRSVTLAAFHLAFILYFALSSSTEVGSLITLAYLKTKRTLIAFPYPVSASAINGNEQQRSFG